jgi:hypothetical protein
MAVIRQAFREGRVSCKRVFERHEKGETDEEQGQEHAHHFLWY